MKRNILVRIIALGGVFAAINNAVATSYYVSPGGSDTNSGTLNAPLQTLAAVMPLLYSGDTLYMRAGTYRETLSPARSGTTNAPITVTVYSNEVAILSGCDVITNTWTLTTNGIYTTSVGWDLGEGYNQIFVDGVLQHEAQYPNWTGTNGLLSPPTRSVTVYPAGRINSSNFSSPTNGYYTGTRFCGRIGAAGSAGWWWQTAVVTNSSGNNLYADTNSASYGWWPDYSGSTSDTGVGFVYGSLNLLDADGEWYLQTNAVAPHTLYLRITGGANPGTHVVEMKRRNWCISIGSINYVTMNGLQTRAGAIQINGTGNVLANTDAGYLSHFMIWANPNNNPGGDYTQGRGISIGGTSNTVTGCTVHETSGSGITLTGGGALVTRNHIYNTDYSGTYASSLFVYSGSDDIITFNTMHDTGRDVLRPFGSGLSIMYNNLYNAGKLCYDLGVIYAISVDGKDAKGMDTRIAYNWLHDNYNLGGDYRSPLIYFDRYCEHFLVDHNVCWNNSGDDGIRLNRPNRYMRAYNNSLFVCDDFGTHVYTLSPPYKAGWTNWTSSAFPEALTNNLYLSSTPQTQLVNWTNNDFRLLSGAAAINAGKVIYDVTNDIDITYGYIGAKPDLGAYEYGGPYWQAGTNGWAVEQPAMQTIGAGSVTTTSATCFGTLISAGMTSATVQVFWGVNDGGTNAANWPANLTLGTNYTGSFIGVTQRISNLTYYTTYTFRFRASNTNGDSWGSALTFQTLQSTATGYDRWAGIITNGLTNYNQSASQDGYPNLLKYATGSSPTQSDTLAKMNSTQTSNGFFALTFNRNTNAADVTLIAEGSYATTNDARWNGIATNIHNSGWNSTNVTENGTGTPVRVTVQDNAAPMTNRFLRLRITRP